MLSTIVDKLPISLRVRVRVAGLGEIAPLAKHGEIGNGRKNESRGDNITSIHRGTDTEYTLRRLKRDAPELQDANSHLDPLMTLEVIPAADHFQLDVEVIGSLPASGQWLHGCGGQWIEIVNTDDMRIRTS